MSRVYTTSWSQARVLDYFWMMVREGADRIALLKQVSAVAIQRPSDWDRAAARAATTPKTRVDLCFACLTGDRRLYWHHIIAIQYGGSTTIQNLVAVCLSCHARIHPWLDVSRPHEERRGTGGWTRVGAMIIKTDETLHETTKDTDTELPAPKISAL